MSCRQLQELQAFYHIEPFGEYRSELRHGQEMAFHHNINRDSKKRPEPFKAIDFMNYVEEPKEKIYTPEELEKYAEDLFGV
jgi:hypothetical protein